ncbi:amidohydrolase [Parabacteroides sp. PF5-6]|uniref:amidohydrolase family protein n=1 Tax=Parabacteroides sp. PF5-6 TaxID=1742403 RepID=UPI0024052C52|nr:amidohydrolase [Parabacteroides sp. PF5-6]MDF9830628.1 5-methylthioadenosine/S-adenosylhomocysteine deaminase [Parabacteroides sp. PF5-6]
MNILIQDVLLDGHPTDIYIEGQRIAKVIRKPSQLTMDNGQWTIAGKNNGTLEQSSETINSQLSIINCQFKKAVVPGFVNAHTHAAMTLFRGFGDDMALMPWLEQKIWPNEARMTDEDVYWGAKLACLEMIKSGTTTFYDMYQRLEATAQAVDEMGIRAVLSGVCFDHFKPELAERSKKSIPELQKKMENYSDRLRFSLGPHAIYTVSGELLQWIDRYSKDNNLLIHLHLAETQGEVDDSLRNFGLTPVRYLHQLGILSPRLLIAHGIYVDKEEIALLAEYGVKVAHNPASNMKLGSGIRFPFVEMKEAGVTVGIGTDGCSSSNNLDMVEAMKLAALLGKGWRKDPEILTAPEMLYAATEAGAAIAGLNTGRIAEGCLADLCLIDLCSPVFTPNFNFVSNLVYAANGSSVDTVICDGKILMENRKVPGEEEILRQAQGVALRLTNYEL